MRRTCIVIALTGFVGVTIMVLLAGFVYFLFILPAVYQDDPDPGIVHSEVAFEKSLALSRMRLGLVSEIRLFPDAPPEKRIGIAGGEGLLWAREDFESGEFHVLAVPRVSVRFAGTDTRGFSHLIGVDTWQGATIYDAEGSALWSPPRRSGINSVAGADFLADGTMQFVAGYNGGGGVSLHDAEGNEIWNKSDGNVWRVAAIQRPGSKDWLIVHSNASGTMKFRGADGEIVSQHRPRVYFSAFSLSPWPSPDSPEHIVYHQDDVVWVYDAEGTLAAEYDAPAGGRLGHAYASPVRLRADAAPYFAVVVRLFMRSILFIYDEDQRLVHHEVLDVPTTAVARMLEGGSAAETLLVGGDGEVWRYRFADTP